MEPEDRDNLAEVQRLGEEARREGNWKRWGPYLAERQWGTVREDYSEDGDNWSYFTHDQARSRAYRWGEDGLLGICDRECRLCFAVTLWNGVDIILKERLYGLNHHEGNHGEDVKELYWYLDSTPTHSYMKALYKYPQGQFPYEQLVEENAKRGLKDPEFELLDTGIFDENRYFDVFAEYAKASPDDILIKLTVANRGPEVAPLHLIPTLWFRNTWVWGCKHEGCETKPWIRRAGPSSVEMQHPTLGRWRLEIEPVGKSPPPEMVFTDNETNLVRVFGTETNPGFSKDGIDHYVVHHHSGSVNQRSVGTKMGVLHVLDVPAGGEMSVRLRLFPADQAPGEVFGEEFERTFAQRQAECEEFYRHVIPQELDAEQRNVSRQAYAGLLWSKQFYHYVIKDWLEGDPWQPQPPPQRKHGRNHDWGHLFNRDVLSMPDKWEYPWYAAWDLAFHMLPMARVDIEFAKHQLLLLLREWYMHPNGQLPAYEFDFSDVNPPVHAWACWRVYKMSGVRGKRDRVFLARAFQKLLLNFTWWVNRKDLHGNHIFAGGFLGLDNIGLFDRSKPLPTGGHLEQADATAWMAFYCGTMLSMAMELASEDPVYEDIASKFFEHFVAIVHAINTLGGTGLWNERDGFYYDQLQIDKQRVPLRVRSMVGVIPLIACEVLEKDLVDRLPGFAKRMHWFLEHEKELAKHVSLAEHREDGDGHPGRHLLLSIPSRAQLQRVLQYLLDESEFLSPYGLRSLSKYHQANPFIYRNGDQEFCVQYVPGESDSRLFGGNSNWRGPVWFPLNYLLIEALERYHHFYGEAFKIECPTGSGHMMTLTQVARELERRLVSLLLPDDAGRRAAHGGERRYADDPHFRELVLFYEYFHGEDGRGLGASHQTGWTALVARCLEDLAQSHRAQDELERTRMTPTRLIADVDEIAEQVGR